MDVVAPRSRSGQLGRDDGPARQGDLPEGIVHGFLALRSETGELLADGALLQTPRGDQVTSRLVFHFRDGSLHDETAVFSQRGSFRLLRDHLVQKGPSFPTSLDASFDVGAGTITVRSRKQDEDEETHD